MPELFDREKITLRTKGQMCPRGELFQFEEEKI